MTEIKKEDLIFQRGEGGKLIPQDIALESIDGKPTIRAVPLTRGTLQEVYSMATSSDIAEKTKADNVIIMKALVSPELTEQETIDLKPQMAAAIVQAILSISLGIEQKDISKKPEEIIADQELALKKK